MKMMKKFLAFLLFLFTLPAWSQVVGNYNVQYVLTAPSGACAQSAVMQVVMGSGAVYTCQSGTWATVGGGGGSGTVTGVLGTANQITSDGSSTTPTLSIPSTFVAPGTIRATTSLASGANGGTSGSVLLNGGTSGQLSLSTGGTAVALTNSGAFLGPDESKALTTYGFTNCINCGMYYVSGASVGLAYAGNDAFRYTNTALRLNSAMVAGWTNSSSDSSGAFDATISRFAAGIVQIGTTTNNRSGLLLTGNSVFVTTNFTTSGSGTALENITGLTWTFPTVAANYNYQCHMAYSQAVGNVAVAFGIKATTNNPTNIFSTGRMQLSTTAGVSTYASGTLPTLATTTATSIVSGTPLATATNYETELSGTLELAASATTITIATSTATAADLVTILRGSYCSLNP